ncbi:hypothetical protein Nham_0135 [Nitrobacter hamburgensis X14]|uniref:Uncharacterized protein n=1 Tax=Nitrobacter hamburgensis (strain DSM 10229 / NCIMB 13809 / X14) TaxID=323097 RepID=Q1QRW1_NITHX|nr:hypothetical protein [Nitrobacter hamburgensis]ABE61036.1 hypothetical protein Nham_0135 [Nitrobacter hamburgensis X14]
MISKEKDSQASFEMIANDLINVGRLRFQAEEMMALMDRQHDAAKDMGYWRAMRYFDRRGTQMFYVVEYLNRCRAQAEKWAFGQSDTFDVEEALDDLNSFAFPFPEEDDEYDL